MCQWLSLWTLIYHDASVLGLSQAGSTKSEQCVPMGLFVPCIAFVTFIVVSMGAKLSQIFQKSCLEDSQMSCFSLNIQVIFQTIFQPIFHSSISGKPGIFWECCWNCAILFVGTESSENWFSCPSTRPKLFSSNQYLWQPVSMATGCYFVNLRVICHDGAL